MRSKEEAHDYRYFPDPDLLPLEFSQEFVDELKAKLPELPDQKKTRFVADFGLSAYDASVLVAERESAVFYETVLDKLANRARDGKMAANWVINELFGRLNKEGRDITGSPVNAEQLAAIIDLIGEGTISGKIAKDLFEIVWQEGGDPRALVESRGMKQVTDLSAIEKVVDDIIAANPDKAAQVKDKPQSLGWFVGQVMKSSGGKANPQAVNDLLEVQARRLTSTRCDEVTTCFATSLTTSECDASHASCDGKLRLSSSHACARPNRRAAIRAKRRLAMRLGEPLAPLSMKIISLPKSATQSPRSASAA